MLHDNSLLETMLHRHWSHVTSHTPASLAQAKQSHACLPSQCTQSDAVPKHEDSNLVLCVAFTLKLGTELGAEQVFFRHGYDVVVLQGA